MSAAGDEFEDVLDYYNHLAEHLRWKNLGHVLAGGNDRDGDAAGWPELEEVRRLGASIP